MEISKRDICTRLLRTRPLLTAAVFFLLGCIGGWYLSVPPVGWLALSLAGFVLCLAVYRLRRRWFAALLIVCLLPLGGLRFSLQWMSCEQVEDQADVSLCGRICQTPVWQEENERTICVLDRITLDGAKFNGKLRLYLRGDVEALQAVALGETVRCTAHLWRADAATNPGEFDFARYLRLQNLSGYATADIAEARFDAAIHGLYDLNDRLRMRIGARIDRLFPANAGIVRAFLLADRSGLSQEERRAYSDAGAAHLLAISGMHISILALLLQALLSRFLKRSHAFIVTLILLCAYGAMIGFQASLLRAILMFSVFSSASLFGRYSDAPTRLGAALLLSLLIRPISILESGFVLSYTASAGIILLSAPLARLTHLDKLLRRRTGVGIHNWLWRFIAYLARSAVATLAAQLALLPAVVWYFGTQPLWSLILNLLAVPLAMAAYVLAIIGCLSGITLPALLSDQLFGLLTHLVTLFANLPLATVGVARFPVWLLVLCALCCLLASDLSRINERVRRVLPLFMIVAALISNGCALLTARGLSVVFLDAGQADCAVVRAQGSVYLVDTGDTYTPAADYLSAMNYSLDGIFLSHPHSDHAGGLRSVLEVTVPKAIYLPVGWYEFEADENIDEALATARRLGSEIIQLQSGDTIALSRDVGAEILSPAAGITVKSANDLSMVLCVRYGEFSGLFCGDLSAEAEPDALPDIDLWKAAHHGSAKSADVRILDQMSPSLTVICVGDNNYGHPNEETLKVLQDAGTAIRRTDQCGAISVYVDRSGEMKVECYGRTELIS